MNSQLIETKTVKNQPSKSVIIKCPSCSATMTIKNASCCNQRYCWRCLKEVLISN